MRKFAAAVARQAVALYRFCVAHPARSRALAVALLAVLAGVIPGLPVDLLNSLIVAALALGAEGVRTVKANRASQTAEDSL